MTVKVTENSGASARTATVNISTASEFGSVKVTQEGTTISIYGGELCAAAFSFYNP